MNRWFKYILITTLFMFIGFSGVSAKTCVYTNSTTTISVDLSSKSASIKSTDGSNKSSGGNLKNSNGDPWSNPKKCPTYVVQAKKGFLMFATTNVYGSYDKSKLEKIDNKMTDIIAQSSSVAEITCEYPINGYKSTIKCSMAANDTTPICTLNEKDGGTLALGNNSSLLVENFKADDGTLKCHKPIYYSVTKPRGGVSRYKKIKIDNLSVEKNSTSNKSTSTATEKSTDNTTENVTQDEIIVCPYSDGFVVRINKTNKTISSSDGKCAGSSVKFT